MPILPEPYFYLSIDGFNAMRDRRELPDDQTIAVLERTVQGFHRGGGNEDGGQSCRGRPRPPGAIVVDRLP